MRSVATTPCIFGSVEKVAFPSPTNGCCGDEFFIP